MGYCSIAKPTHRKKISADVIQTPSDRSIVPPMSFPILDPRETEKMKEDGNVVYGNSMSLRSLIHSFSHEKNKTTSKSALMLCSQQETISLQT